MNLTPHPNDPNLAMLELVAWRLGEDLCCQFTFVGGAVAGLLITDPAHPAIRPTEDVDVVAEVLALTDYHALEQQLRCRGFAQNMRPDAPICRWQVDGITLDVMPTQENILGFANRWYPLCVATADALVLPGGSRIRVIQAPVFIGTKLEAFHGRGGGDYLFSHDLGDVISVIDGRDSLLDECRQAAPALRAYLAQEFATLLAKRSFLDALPGHLPGDAVSQERLPDLQAKMQQIASLSF